MREKIEFLIVKFLINLTKLLSKKVTYKLFKFLALIIFKLDKKRYKITINNLKNLYPNKNYFDLKSIAREVFINISKTLTEALFIYTNKIQKDDILNMIDDSDLDKFYKYKNSANKRSIIFITAHFGNWELLPQFMALKGIVINGVGREGNNKLIEDNLTTPLREKFGNKNIFKKGAGVTIVKTLKRGKNIGLLIDQKAGLKNGVVTKFFNRDVTTTNLVANLKLKSNPLIIPIYLARVNNEKFKLIIKEPIEYRADEIENKDEKIKTITQKYNDVLEDVIREYPTQWFWMHNRWKM